MVVVALRADDDALELESEIDAEQDRFKEELGEERKRTLEQVRRQLNSSISHFFVPCLRCFF